MLATKMLVSKLLVRTHAEWTIISVSTRSFDPAFVSKTCSSMPVILIGLNSTVSSCCPVHLSSSVAGSTFYLNYKINIELAQSRRFELGNHHCNIKRTEAPCTPSPNLIPGTGSQLPGVHVPPGRNSSFLMQSLSFLIHISSF